LPSSLLDAEVFWLRITQVFGGTRRFFGCHGI
jgi:hypothetical protein